MQRKLVCFSHGQESGPQGTKICAMTEVAERMGFATESLDYRGMDDPSKRVRKLVGHCGGLAGQPVLVGSSMGGHVAAAATAGVSVAGLFLIAPAFYMPGYEALTPHPACPRIVVVHGWGDEVVPVDNSIRWAREHGADLHLIPGDHRLSHELDAVLRLFAGFLSTMTVA